MGKTVILSEQTARDLLEAYASLAAWYYQLWGAVRSGTGAPQPPEEDARRAFLERLAHDYPELAATAKSITAPRSFVPPPAALPTDLARGNEEAATLVEPAPARMREMMSEHAQGEIAPPPLVAPGSVRYTR